MDSGAEAIDCFNQWFSHVAVAHSAIHLRSVAVLVERVTGLEETDDGFATQKIQMNFAKAHRGTIIRGN